MLQPGVANGYGSVVQTSQAQKHKTRSIN